MTSSVHSFFGDEAYQFKNDLARLRIQVFREFPYLYDGSLGYEEQYLESFIHARDSIVSIAFDGDRVVGASTGIPMAFEPPEVQQPWRDSGHDVSKIFYFSESVLLKEYRGLGIGVRFFQEREAWARKLGRFNILTFCAVVRPPDHPQRPPDYSPLNQFWEKRGFAELDGHSCQMSWKDVGEEGESTKVLQFWCKGI